MTALDWIILAFTVLMALWGYQQGLIVGLLSLLGFAAGAFAGSRLAPLLLDEGSRSPYAPLFSLVLALFLGGLMATGLEVVGFHVRHRMGDVLGTADGVGGAALVACVGLGVAWIAAAVVLQAPGTPREARREIQRSEILRRLNSVLPPSGPILKSLARLDPFPRINAPAPDVRAPDSRIGRDPDVRRAARSVVRVLGTACGLRVQGSGWVAGDGIVVTNAHVVAGQDDTVVQVVGDGPDHDAEAVHFDPRNDLAILRASGVSGVPALQMDVDAKPGRAAAIVGFPKNGPLTIEPARLGGTSNVLSEDAYGRGPITRRITSLRGEVKSGNSGGPAVDGRGRVLATIFAAGTSEDNVGFGVPDSVVNDALAELGGRVSTGPCTR